MKMAGTNVTGTHIVMFGGAQLTGRFDWEGCDNYVGLQLWSEGDYCISLMCPYVSWRKEIWQFLVNAERAGWISLRTASGISRLIVASIEERGQA